MSFKVCIDPGHGMGNASPNRFDPGAVAAGHTEADIVLQWALTMRWIGIHEFGIDPKAIVLTRDDSTDYLPVYKRDDIAVSKGCKYFVSLHCNAAVSSQANGVETVWAGYQNPDDKAFAQKVQDVWLKGTGLRSRGVKTMTDIHKNLAVLASTKKLTCCLVEMGFITNDKDRAAMLDRDVRIKTARLFWESLGFKRQGVAA